MDARPRGSNPAYPAIDSSRLAGASRKGTDLLFALKAEVEAGVDLLTKAATVDRAQRARTACMVRICPSGGSLLQSPLRKSRSSRLREDLIQEWRRTEN